MADFQKALQAVTELDKTPIDDKIKASYRIDYWNKIWGENIHSQPVANLLFDWFKANGYHAIEQVQKLLEGYMHGLVPGVMDTKTIRAINGAGSDLLRRLIDLRIRFVKNIVATSPSKAEHLETWIARIKTFG